MSFALFSVWWFLLITLANQALAAQPKYSSSWLSMVPRGGQEDPVGSEGFEILGDRIVYSGWRTITQRKVRMRNGKIVDFDVSQALDIGSV